MSTSSTPAAWIASKRRWISVGGTICGALLGAVFSPTVWQIQRKVRVLEQGVLPELDL